ncbi:MAG TPA: hypothetical protein VMY43_05750 [Methanothrix sp.]|nr:hypothetical protein [Methanothrix sp.]
MIAHTLRNVVKAKLAVNDSGTMEVSLGDEGGIAAIFLKFQATNGAGGSASYGILPSITEIRVKMGGGRYPFRLSASDLYAINAIRDGRAEELSEGAGAGAMQSVRLPIYFGADKQDRTHGIDLKANAGATLEVDYTLVISDADGFVTKSLRLDVDVLETKGFRRPAYRGMIETAVANIHTTKVADPVRVKLHDTGRMVGLYAYAYLSGTADNALVSNIELLAPGENKLIVDASFSDLQYRHRTLSGSILTSYASIWMAQGRTEDEILMTKMPQELELNLKELAADGSVRIIEEVMR